MFIAAIRAQTVAVLFPSPDNHTIRFGGSAVPFTPTGSSDYAVDATYHLVID